MQKQKVREVIDLLRVIRSFRSDQIRSVAQLCPTLCDPMNCSTPGHPVYHQLPEFTETHVHRVSNAIWSSHPLSSPSPLAPNPSQHQSLFQWVDSNPGNLKQKPVLKLCNTVSQSQDKNPVHQAKLKDECQTGPSDGHPDCKEYRSDRGDGMDAIGVKR